MTSIKSIAAVFALSILMAIAAIAQAPPPPPPAKPKPVSAWQTFTFTEGNFSVLMPKPPMEMKQEIQSPIGKVPVKIFTAQNGLVSYMVFYAEYPIAFDTPAAVKATLDGMREMMLSKGGQVISERDISYGRFPGHQMTAKTPRGLLSTKFFVINQYGYLLMTTTPLDDDKDFAQSKDVEKYLDSFKLLKEPSAPPASLGSMSKIDAAAEKISPPPDFFSRPVAWRKFSPPEFGFSIQLPGEPYHVATPLNPNDRRLDIQLWMSKGEDFVCEVMVQPLLTAPSGEVQRNLLFKGLLEGLLEDGEMKLLSEKPISFQGHPGREYALQMSFGTATGKAFLAGNTVYMLIGIPTETNSSVGMAKFFDSFTVTKGAVSGQGDDPPPPIKQQGETRQPRKINVSGGVLQGNAIRKVQPLYPPEAKQGRVQGAVQIQILVSEEGEVIDATAISGPPELREVALNAARQWQFKPTELAGVPVKVQGILTFNFTLR